MAIHVVGLGLDPADLPSKTTSLIRRARVLVAGERHLQRYAQHPAIKIPIVAPLSSTFAQIREHEQEKGPVVILASGDPMFYGIGPAVIEEFGAGAVTILPNITTIQAAAARIKAPWSDIATVSLHGRQDMHPLFLALGRYERIAVLTDTRSIPAALAQAMLDKGLIQFRIWVFEDLGGEAERFDLYTLEAASQKNFSALNLVLFERTAPMPERPQLGIPDEEFVTERGLITKWSVRSAALAALRISRNHTVWVLGAGCGAVSIEASSLARTGRVFAVEKKAGRIRHIRENIRRFTALLVEPVHGIMPDCLEVLPQPDRIFLGGGLGQPDNSVIEAACACLVPGGRIVASCVLMDSLIRTKACFEAANWPYSITMITVAHSSPLAASMHLEGQNPVFLVAAEKPEVMA